MKKRLLVLLTVLLVLAACTPGAFAYDVVAEQAADFGTASLILFLSIVSSMKAVTG